MLKMIEELGRMERGKKLLGKQSYVSESETNILSAGELSFCSFVFKKLKMGLLNAIFVLFIHLQTRQAIRRTRQAGSEEAGLKHKTSWSLLGSDTAQVTSLMPQLSLV